MTPSQAARAADVLRLFDVEAQLQPARPAAAASRRIVAGSEVFPVPPTASDEITAAVVARLLPILGSARLEVAEPPRAPVRTAAPSASAVAGTGGTVLAALRARRAAAQR